MYSIKIKNTQTQKIFKFLSVINLYTSQKIEYRVCQLNGHRINVCLCKRDTQQNVICM